MPDRGAGQWSAWGALLFPLLFLPRQLPRRRSPCRPSFSSWDDAGQELLGFLGGEHGRFTLLDDVLGTAYRAGRVEFDNATAGQPIEAHADGCQVPFDGGGRAAFGHGLNISGNVHRLDAGERQVVPFAPGEEIADGSGVCLPGVAIADGGGQELDKSLACLLASVGDDGGRDRAAVCYQPINFRCLDQEGVPPVVEMGETPPDIFTPRRVGIQSLALGSTEERSTLSDDTRGADAKGWRTCDNRAGACWPSAPAPVSTRRGGGAGSGGASGG